MLRKEERRNREYAGQRTRLDKSKQAVARVRVAMPGFQSPRERSD